MPTRFKAAITDASDVEFRTCVDRGGAHTVEVVRNHELALEKSKSPLRMCLRALDRFNSHEGLSPLADNYRRVGQTFRSARKAVRMAGRHVRAEAQKQSIANVLVDSLTTIGFSRTRLVECALQAFVQLLSPSGVY